MSKPLQYSDLKDVCIIGGGEPFVFTGGKLKELGYNVKAILAPRHAESKLPLTGEILIEALQSRDIETHLLEDINEPGALDGIYDPGAQALALCFGPAWVFNDEVMGRFGRGMINFNGIPIPRYLGGAHYTWQILNNDRTVGMAMQEITNILDRGDILRFEEFLLPSSARIPQDYYEGNYQIACNFLGQFVEDMKAGVTLPRVPYDIFKGRRFYFPRLMTLPQGLVDWSWTVKEIERFCCAFDKPFPGASSFLNGERVHLRNVGMEQGDGYTHPFCAGLVVRQSHNAAWVAAKDGLVVIREAVDEDGNDILNKLKEGRRLNTRADMLDDAREYRPQITGRLPK